MATNFPGGTDVLTNPVGTNLLDNPDHAAQHTNANDAIEAIESNVGTNSGTNIFNNFTVGQFPLRVTGGGATGTHITTLVGGTFANTALIGTPQISGGTIGGGIVNATGGTLNNTVQGTPAITGGTWTNPAMIGTGQITGGTVSAGILANNTIGTPNISAGTWLNAGLIGTSQITGGSLTTAVIVTPTINIASDAAGDLYYRSSAGSLQRLAAGTLNHVLSSGGIGTAPSWVASSAGLGTAAQGAKVYLSADGTLFNGTAYKIAFDTETYDTGAAFGTAANEYVVPANKGGYYTMGVFAYLYGSLTTGNQFKSYVYINGAEIHEDQFVCAANNTGETTKCITFHHVNAGATIAFYSFSPQANTKIYANGGVATHTWAFVQQITQD